MTKKELSTVKEALLILDKELFSDNIPNEMKIFKFIGNKKQAKSFSTNVRKSDIRCKTVIDYPGMWSVTTEAIDDVQYDLLSALSLRILNKV